MPIAEPTLNAATMQSLESAAFAAWPSQVSIDVDGWQLRLDRGYTKRANSANATVRSQPLSKALVDDIEGRFRRSGLTPIFRLTSFAPVAEADALLETLGYRHFDPSLVMTRPLSDLDIDGPSHEMQTIDAATWLRAFQLVSGHSGAEQTHHLDILQRVTHPCAWATLADAGSPLCCGLGVVVDQNLGLFDIATHVEHQRQGLARQLCGRMLAWGRKHGADTAFLQVAATNSAALRLYESLGFQVAYQYWYRVHQAPPNRASIAASTSS